MRTRRESAGGSLLRRYLEHIEIRGLHVRHYTGFASPIIRRRYETSLRPSDSHTIVDLTSPPTRKKVKVERTRVAPVR
jgi:hypothetical protein